MRTILNTRTILFLGAGVLALAAQGRANAAEKITGGATAALDEVVVTARRREERLQDVPISVVALRGDQLAARGVVKLDDLQNAIPGIKIEPQNDKTTTIQITIRGMRMYGGLNAQDAPTAFYFADAPVSPIIGLNSGMYDLESVQVLKGPQGTLFGKNTDGGALLITPNKPADTKSAALNLRLGNYSERRGEGFINIPLGNDFLLRLAISTQDHGSYYRYSGVGSMTGQGVYDDHLFGARLSAIWKPTDKIENYIVTYYDKMRSSTIPSALVAVNPNSALAARYGYNTPVLPGYPALAGFIWNGEGKPKFYASSPSFDLAKVYGIVNTTTMQLESNMSLKNIFSLRHVKNSNLEDYTGSPNPNVIGAGRYKTDAYSEELQLSGLSFGQNVNWVAGAFYQYFRADAMTEGAVFYNSGAASTVSPFASRVVNKSYAGYGQFTAKISSSISFTAGGRYTIDKRFIDYRSQTSGQFVNIGVAFAPRCVLVDDNGVLLPVSACSIKRAKTFKQPTYTLSLDYKITGQTMVYISQRTGYRAGGFNERASTILQRIPFNPEKVLSREIGSKSDFKMGGIAARLNLALYHDRYKDLQKNVNTLINGTTVANSTFNAAAGYVEGAEVEVVIKPIRELTLGVSYAYTNANYTSFPYLIAGKGTFDFSNRKFSGIPKNSYTFHVSYDFPMDESAGMVSLSGDYNYQGSSFVSDVYQNNAQLGILYTPERAAALPANNEAAYKMRSYHIINARLQWAQINDSPLTLALWARNLTNTYAEVFNNPAYESTGNTSIGFAPPRTYGVEMSYKF